MYVADYGTIQQHILGLDQLIALCDTHRGIDLHFTVIRQVLNTRQQNSTNIPLRTK